MGEIVRVLVEVHSSTADASWRVRFSLPTRPGVEWPNERILNRTNAGASQFPTVDETASGLPKATEPHYDFCVGRKMEDLSELYDRITRRALISGKCEASIFGKYLFDTLIGREVWGWILNQTTKTDLLELALAWDSDQINLHRINWEMMHGPEAFLAARQVKGPREIAITRIVADADSEARTARPVPRCLFVIGTALTDVRIRPGAELMGLLRQIERSGRAVRGRVLRGDQGAGATPADITRAVTEFSPDFVHIICHGEFDDRGSATLELGVDPSKPGERSHKTDLIFEYLNAGGALPSALVLSACNTGQSKKRNLLQAGPLEVVEAGEVAIRGAHETAPMAAYLVRKGIPVVIGMAGRVADRACRHFSRRFGEALVKGEPLVQATAEGRRAAFVEGEQSPEESVDWAFPAVFMSAKVPADHRPAPRSPEGEPPVEHWVSEYHPERGKEPAFCARHEFFDAYYDLFDREKVSVLAVYVSGIDSASDALKKGSDIRHGKTRLLRELTVQAIRDGHVPVVVSRDSENQDTPTTLEDLLRSMLRALNFAKNTYEVDIQAWQIGALQKLLKGEPPALAPQVLEVFNEDGAITARLIRAALAADMTDLLEKAHAKHQFLRDARGTAILLLDDVEKYWIGFLERWFDGKVLKTGGIRGSRPAKDAPWNARTTILPVVMTFSTAKAPEQVTNVFREKGSTLTWMRLMKLEPFPLEGDVDLLAIQNVLLNPFDETGQIREGVSNRSFALNYKADRETWEIWTDVLRQNFRGLPSYFVQAQFYQDVYVASRYRYFNEADDETKLAAYMNPDARK